jgi:uncharacterized protein
MWSLPPVLRRHRVPTANHGFCPSTGSWSKSSWFPLCERNPQTFVRNIFWAKPADYRKPQQRVYYTPEQASFIELPLVVTP